MRDSLMTSSSTIAILLPVLQKGHSKTWNGIYFGRTIPFKIEEKDFLKKILGNRENSA